MPKFLGPDGMEESSQEESGQDLTGSYWENRKDPDNWPANKQRARRGRGRDRAEGGDGGGSGGGSSGGGNSSGGGGGSQARESDSNLNKPNRGQEGPGQSPGNSSNVAYMHFPKESRGASEGGNQSMYSIPTYPASLAVNGGLGFGGAVAPVPYAAGLQQSGTDLGTLLVSNSVAEVGTEALRGNLEVQQSVANLGFNILRDDKVSTLFFAKDSKDTAVQSVAAAKDAEIRALQTAIELQSQIKDENNRTRDLVLALDKERTQREFDRTERRLERVQAERDNDRIVAMLAQIAARLS